MEKEVGIELLKDLTTDVVKVLGKVKDAREDGEISKAEVVGMLPSIAAVGKDLFSFQGLVKEAKDFTTYEGKELLNHIITLGVISDKAQVVAINVVEIIEKELEVYETNIKPIISALKK